MKNQLTKTDFTTEIAVPAEDSADDVNVVDVVGKKSDTTAGDSLVAVSKQIVLDTGTTIPGTITTAQSDITHILNDTGTTIPGTITTLQSDVTAVKAVTDVIPDAGALTTLQSNVTDILADTGTTIPATITTLNTAVVTDIPASLVTIDTVVDTNQDFLDGTTATPTAYRREYGVIQVKEVSITAAANAGVTTVATITTQPCMIKSVTIHADAAQTADMTTCAVEGGVNQVVEFIGTTDAIQANLDAADKQVGWTGAVRLAATKTIAIDLQGTGATATDLTVTIEYMSCVDGGYLV